MWYHEPGGHVSPSAMERRTAMTIERGAAERVALGEYTLDAQDERLWGPAGQVRLGNKAFLVLSRLIEERGRLVTKDALFSSVWDGTIVSESALTSVMKELRRALGDDPRNPRYIESVYGRGYRLLAPVEAATGPASANERPCAGPARPAAGAIDVERSATGLPPLLCVPAFNGSQLGAVHQGLADVMREEVLLALSRFRDLRLVTDAAAVKAGTGAHEDADARNYQLGVRLVADGDAVTLYARIVRLGTQEVIWANREFLAADSVASGIEGFIAKIAAALPRVQDDVLRHLPSRADDAYSVYLHTKLAMRAAEDHDAMRAIAHRWEALIAERPDFAPAYAPLIYLYNTDYGYTGLGSTTDAERARACALAHKAVRIDPLEPHLHAVLAWCHLWSGDTDMAREPLRRTLELNPFHKDRLLEVATAFMFMDELDTAADLLARCAALSPFATEAPHEETGLLHLLRGRYDEALRCLRRMGRPTVSSELYALLAASASGEPSLARQAGEWVGKVRHHWRGSVAPDGAALSGWVLYHHPFQNPARREWVLARLTPALSAAPVA